MEIIKIIKLCEARFGVSPEKVEQLPGGGGGRRYRRVFLPENREGEPRRPATLIATSGPDVAENRAFCNLSRDFAGRAVWYGTSLVPEVYAESDSGELYLQQDLGNLSFLDWMQQTRRSVEDADDMIEENVRYVLGGLLAMQNVPASYWDKDLITHPFDRLRVAADLYYFKDCYLRPSGVAFDEDRLNREIELFAGDVCAFHPQMIGFMYRDFQSRNVMVRPGWDERMTPYFIDFQGGMLGPMVYDAISFLWQAKAGFTPEFRERMLRYYLGMLAGYRDIPLDEGLREARLLVAARVLQVLGAYGFRGLVEHKAHFIESIPNALENLKGILENGTLRAYPELERVCRELMADPRFAESPHQGLLVEVLSFSYKRGYPANFTGNGGGFVFDCRGMHNPGRYEEYRMLTGMDRPVIDFLEERGEVQEFMRNAGGLVVPTVTTYLRRGFTNLQVAFGCTGGQHRSVYCAEAMARMLRESFPELPVRVIHRERGITYDKD